MYLGSKVMNRSCKSVNASKCLNTFFLNIPQSQISANGLLQNKRIMDECAFEYYAITVNNCSRS